MKIPGIESDIQFSTLNFFVGDDENAKETAFYYTVYEKMKTNPNEICVVSKDLSYDERKDLLKQETKCFFLENPENNTHPKYMKELAETIFNICKNGPQIFMSTNSLFMLRELSILSKDFSLISSVFINISQDKIEYGNLDDIAISLVDEELKQSDRYTEMVSDLTKD